MLKCRGPCGAWTWDSGVGAEDGSFKCTQRQLDEARHGLEDVDVVMFCEVNGMEEIKT